MSEEKTSTVFIPYFAHEGEMSRMERANKRLWIIIIVLIFCLVGTNLAWVVYENQFQDVVIEQDGYADNGSHNIFNGTGEMNYGGTWTPEDQDPREP